MSPRSKPPRSQSSTAALTAKDSPEIVSLARLRPDQRNARRRTERSSKLIENSLSEFGAARSIVIDEEGKVLAGNGTLEAAAAIGIDQVLVVPADGNTLVAVQRIDLDERQKVRYAIADNRASDLSEWDAAILSDLSAEDPDLKLESFFSESELDALMADLSNDGLGDEETSGKSQGKLEVKLEFDDPADFDAFTDCLQQLAAALPNVRTTEQRLQLVLEQFLSSDKGIR